LSRRRFLAGASGSALGLLGLGGLAQPAATKELQTAEKRVLVIWLAGGVSQLETWDPKPSTDTGGPFRAIPTSATGVHISELLPYTAKQMHHLALVRGVNTASDDHGIGQYIMHTGRRPDPAQEYPHLGSALSKFLGASDASLPGYMHITPGGGGGFGAKDAAFLGPKYASMTLGDGKPPANLLRPADLAEDADQDRRELRDRLDKRFNQKRKSADTEAYTHSYEQAAQLMKQRKLFDIENESPRFRDRYGNHEFGRHCLLARRLLESNVSFVQVTHSNYDSHHENFDFHIEQLGEFDRTFATLVEDLQDRSLLDSTLIIVMSEFGRTPRINQNIGRDHWSKAWSVAVGGCGIKGGVVVGKTNANGTAVTEREVNGGHLFHTYFQALGLDPTKNYYVNQRPIPVADPKAGVIKEVLA